MYATLTIMSELKKLTPYVMQGLIVGIIAGVLFLWLFKPASERPKVVELKEAETPDLSDQALGSGAVSYAAAVGQAAPAVVNIYTTKIVRNQANPLFDDPLFRRFFGDRFSQAPQQRLQNSLGSGVIISAQGYVLTNNHVIADADEILVALRDGRSVAASVVGTDPDSDLAVLRVPADNLPSVTLGQSEKLQVGDVVLAIGNPFGVGQTVTMGIVSATGRTQLGISTFENFIQTDAAINPGNSGGALINAYGQLVGINTAIFSRTGGSQGIGFAIPTSIAKQVLEQIIEYGRAIRGWLGIEVQDLTPELAESFNLKTTQGVIVAGVLKQGPAALAGVQPGDIIVKLNDQDIRDANHLMNQIANMPPNSSIKVDVVRAQKNVSLDAVIGERPAR